MRTIKNREYLAYLRSPEWKQKRKIALYHANNRCAGCGAQFWGGRGLDVHHKTYANFKHEPLSDLQVLCRVCHDSVHNGDSTWPQQVRYKLHLYAWAERVYGSHWERQICIPRIEAEYARERASCYGQSNQDAHDYAESDGVWELQETG